MHRRYNAASSDVSTEDGAVAAYARVSTQKQKPFLDFQLEQLRRAEPSVQIVTDIGSGLNFKRRGLQRILTMVFARRFWQLTRLVY